VRGRSTDQAIRLDPDLSERSLDQQARSLGVRPERLARMICERERLVAKVVADPRAWGFDLRASDDPAPRRDVVAAYRDATQLTGRLGESFLTAYEPLMAAVPDPPTMPDETPLDGYLQAHSTLGPEAAGDLACHVRAMIQSNLGRPLDADGFLHAVRETAWDHDLDAVQVGDSLLRAVRDLLRDSVLAANAHQQD
jgi:hypothetical protein